MQIALSLYVSVIDAASRRRAPGGIVMTCRAISRRTRRKFATFRE